jgi:MFS family permease
LSSLLRIYVTVALITSSHGGAVTVLPPFLNDLGFPVQEIGYVSAVIGLMQLVSRMPIGTLYLVHRARQIMFLCLLSMAVSAIGYRYVHTLSYVLLLSALYGLGLGGATTVITALCLDLRPEGHDLGRTVGWFGAAIGLGYLTSNLSLSYTADHLGYGMALMATGLLPIAALLVIMTIPIPSDAKKIVSDDGPQPANSEGGLMVVLLNPDILAATLIALAMTFVTQSIDAFFPIHALGIGFSLTAVGLLRSLASISTTVVRPLSPLAFRFVSLRIINAACVLLSAAAMMLLPHFSAFPVLMILFSVVGLTRGVSRVSGTTLIAQGGRHIGLASGIFNAGFDLGGIVGPFIGGVLAASTDISIMFRVLGVLLIAFYFVALGLSERMGRGVPPRCAI